MILTIKTDQPEAEVSVYIDNKKVTAEKWQAHRELSSTLHQKIQQTIEGAGKKLTDIKGVVVYKGPGSFTGLRIGISVANALAYSFNVPITGQNGTDWINKGLIHLLVNKKFAPVVPEYGSPAHTTEAKK